MPQLYAKLKNKHSRGILQINLVIFREKEQIISLNIGTNKITKIGLPYTKLQEILIKNLLPT